MDTDANDYGSRYGPGHTVSELQNTYTSDSHIEPLIRAGLLPEDLGDADFTATAKALQTRLSSEHSAHEGNARTAAWEFTDRRLNRQAKGLHRAMQLRRRHDEAATAEREANVIRPAGVADDAATEVHNTLVAGSPQEIAAMSDSEWETYARRMGLVNPSTGQVSRQPPVIEG